jgi:quaternary ammonium compound-resistance protein SugE
VVGTALAGIALFNEPVNLPRLTCIGLVLIGIAGLKLAES